MNSCIFYYTVQILYGFTFGDLVLMFVCLFASVADRETVKKGAGVVPTPTYPAYLALWVTFRVLLDTIQDV